MSETKSPEKVPLTSLNPVSERLELLKSLMPEVFTEEKVDFDKLKIILGHHIDGGMERYGLTWAGKSEATFALQMPSHGTLTPISEESVNFETSENFFIEGDNLEVLKLLQRSYYEKIKLVYIDPPYNTGKNDFIYPDNYREGLEDYLVYSKQRTVSGERQTSNEDTSGRKHSKWLSMMYPRLFLARNLLKEDGVIICHIDETELSNLISILNEIFGETNRIGIISWRNVTDNNPTLINKDNEFIVFYAKSKSNLPDTWKSFESDEKELLLNEYKRLDSISDDISEIETGINAFIRDNGDILGNLKRYKFVDKDGVYTGSESVHNPRAGGYDFEVIHPDTGKPMRKPANGYRFPEKTFREMEDKKVILYGKDEKRIVKIKKYLHDFEDSLRSVITMDGRLGSYDLKRVLNTKKSVFSNPKPVDLVSKLISFATESNDYIMDFFAGSGTLGEAVMRLNAKSNTQRRYLLIQLPEEIKKSDVAYKEFGFTNITQLAQARLTKTIEDLRLEEIQGSGFKSFKLTASNFKIWDSNIDVSELKEQLPMFSNNLTEESTTQSLLFEIILKTGLQLDASIQPLKLAGDTVYNINNKDLYVSLADAVTKNLVEEVTKEKPKKFVCLDNAFQGNDQLKTNTVLTMKSKKINFYTV